MVKTKFRTRLARARYRDKKKPNKMLLLTQTGGGALSATRCCSSHKFAHANPPIFSKRNRKFVTTNPDKRLNFTVVNAEGGVESTTGTKQQQPPRTTTTASTSSSSTSLFDDQETVFVGDDSVPLEGVIQFDKPNSSSKLDKWGRVALLSGGDVLAILLFSAIGRFSHGFPVFDAETLRTADPFIAGWFLSAYFLGGYGEDGRGMNGLSKAVLAAAKSWGLGIPLGIFIRSTTAGHIPPVNFILVTMGSTAFLLIGWRALLFSIFTGDSSKKNDVYRRGSPFELFELLTSLIRRW